MPSSVHQQFVENAIDKIIELGSRFRKSDPNAQNQELYNFRMTLEALSQFLTDYKKSVHEKDDGSTPASTESMDIEGGKNAIIARCAQNSGQKDVYPFHP